MATPGGRRLEMEGGATEEDAAEGGAREVGAERRRRRGGGRGVREVRAEARVAGVLRAVGGG
nr:unnamed protein product [Digitaria exilis]